MSDIIFLWQTGWGIGLPLIALGMVAGKLRQAKTRSAAPDHTPRRVRELEALNEITTVANQSSDLAEILNTGLKKSLDLLGIEQGGIYLLDESCGLLMIAAQRGLSEQFINQIDGLKMGEGFSGRVALSGVPLVIKDLAQDERLTRKVVVETGMHSVAVAPVGAKGNVFGTIFAITKEYREFQQHEVDLLTSIGSQVGAAIEHFHLLADTKKRLAQLTALQETSRAVVSTLDLNKLLELIIQQAATLLQAEGGILNLVHWDQFTDEVVACIGSTVDAAGIILPLDCSLSGWVTLHNQPQFSNNVREDTRVNRDPEVFRRQFTNAAIVPLSIKDRVIGTLVVVDKLGGSVDFDQADLDLLMGFANQAAAAIENARLYQSEKRRAEQFQAVSEVSRRLTLILDVEELLKQLVKVIQQTFRFYHVAIGLIEGDELVYRVGSGVLWDDPDFQFRPMRLKVGQEGIGGWVAATGKPFLVKDVNKEPQYVCMKGSATLSELTVPIFVKEKVIGVLDAQSDQLDAFDETDLLVLQSLAYQAGAAIENARLFHAEQRRAEQFRVINEVGRRIISVTAVDELLGQMAQLIQQSFGYYHVGIGLIEGNEVVSRAEVGAYTGIYQNAHIPMGEGSWGWVAQHGKALLQLDKPEAARFQHGSEIKPERSHVCVPLQTKDAVIGVLSAASDKPHAFDASDQMVLQSLAHQAAMAVENIRFYEHAQQMAVMDERSRLARELHDAVTQTLFSASLIAEAVPSAWEKDPQQGLALLQDLRSLSRGALAEMRTLLLELRPAAVVETRMADLLRQLGEAASGREGFPVDIILEGDGALPPDVHVAIYRIAQEALNNVVKHARASQVTIRLCTTCTGNNHGALLSIVDNGRGFDLAQAPHHRLGLGIMQERAQSIGATLLIESCPGGGTQVTVLWEQGREG